MWTVYRVTDNDDKQAPDVVDLIGRMRPRPELYLGERSASALWHFLQGYYIGLGGNSPKSAMSPMSKEFHDWVAYRLHFLESTMGWRGMILKHSKDEPAALDRFFELFDEFRARVPHIVARLEGLDQQYRRVWRGVESVCSFPSTLLLLTYTEDPGFFVISDTGERFPGDGFVPFLRWFESSYKGGLDRLTIVDPVTYARLQNEDRPKK